MSKFLLDGCSEGTVEHKKLNFLACPTCIMYPLDGKDRAECAPASHPDPDLDFAAVLFLMTENSAQFLSKAVSSKKMDQKSF